MAPAAIIPAITPPPPQPITIRIEGLHSIPPALDMLSLSTAQVIRGRLRVAAAHAEGQERVDLAVGTPEHFGLGVSSCAVCISSLGLEFMVGRVGGVLAV